jgi:lipid-binding SYLF domain-containing protein
MEQLVTPGSQGPKGKPTAVIKIPTEVLQRCVGLAIFTTMRSGLWMSGAGGSGVVIARKEDGDWSPPSGLHVQTLGFGFMAGIDIYDCVVVINSREALKAFSKFRFTLGGELSAVAGPIGVGGTLEVEVSKANKPIFTYMKSRGVYCGVQLDTTVIIERNDENARFYGERLSIDEIFAGRVKNIPSEARMLIEAVRRAEGISYVDNGMVENDQSRPGPPPAYY